MFKINLKDVKNALLRDEMRLISGGSGGDYEGCKTACKICSTNSECCSGVCSSGQPACGAERRCLK